MELQPLFLIIIVVAVAIFDVWIIKSKGKKASISAWSIRLAYKYPSAVFIIAFGLGYVMGHITWRMRTLDVYECESKEVQEIIRECKND